MKNNKLQPLKIKSRGFFLDFLLKHVNAKYSLSWLWILFLFEVFLILPLDLVIVFYSLQHKGKALFLSITAAACSTASALVGYLIGLLLFERFSYIFFRFISESSFLKITAFYQTYEKSAVFLGTLLPLPFKLITMSAGVCHVPIYTFLIMVFLARVTRFLAISLITIKLQDRIFDVIEKYSRGLFLSACCIFLIVLLWALR